jgi:hypothetical protein
MATRKAAPQARGSDEGFSSGRRCSLKPLTKAIVVAGIQVLIVCSLGAKLFYDRHTRPQVWFKTARYDPNLPIRGRYLALQLELDDPRSPQDAFEKFGNWTPGAGMGLGYECGSIVAREGMPIVVFDNSQTGDCDNLRFVRWNTGSGGMHLRLEEPVLFFIPDTAQDPRSTRTGDETWVLATIPRKGPPRPIALGVKKAGTTSIERLDLN